MKNQIIFDFYNTLYNPKTNVLFMGIPTLLRQLQPVYRLILVTVEGKSRQLQISKLSLNKYFSKIIVCPQKSVFVFQKLLREKSNTLIIGDRAEEEITIAQTLKLQFIKVNPELENPAKTIRNQLIQKT